jgi:hypothetical protein
MVNGLSHNKKITKNRVKRCFFNATKIIAHLPEKRRKRRRKKE